MVQALAEVAVKRKLLPDRRAVVVEDLEGPAAVGPWSQYYEIWLPERVIYAGSAYSATDAFAVNM